MADDAVTSLETLVHSALDPAGLAPMLELWDRFDTNHPSDPPHAYLNLLATHPAHRGLGIAQGLLAESLARFDAAGLPTYLESTNPANDHRYRRAGYERIGEFATPHTGSPVALGIAMEIGLVPSLASRPPNGATCLGERPESAVASPINTIGQRRCRDGRRSASMGRQTTDGSSPLAPQGSSGPWRTAPHGDQVEINSRRTDAISSTSMSVPATLMTSS